ncbi:SpoIIE family protein phosphatase [Streptomyces sp. NPDC056309]|uniref:SpoIIE family protein phosphatase n=1 Tax=unclassified Streptomyces TaxID=2593676 RepID=UPI0035D85154
MASRRPALYGAGRTRGPGADPSTSPGAGAQESDENVTGRCAGRHHGDHRLRGAASPAPPLGLGGLGRDHPHVDEVGFPSGATLLLYTDGVIEARNRPGDFYPLAERLPGWSRLRPQALVEAVHSDLRRHVGRGLGDDVTLVAVQRDRRP